MSAKDFVREWGPTVADAALLVIGFSLDHQDVLSRWLRDWYPIIQPTGFVALGAFGGYSVARTLGRRALAKETGQSDTRIASLETELKARPTQDQLESLEAELTEITDRFDLDRFTAPQLDLMALMYDIQNESGSMAIAPTSQYEAMAKRLADEGVMTRISDSGRLGQWSLLPDWVRFVAGHRAEIDERSERARSYRQAEEELARHGKSKGYRLALPSVEQDRADCTRLRETFVHGIDPEQQAAVVDAWLSPGRRLDVSKRPVRGLGEGIALSEFLVPDSDGWARATDGAVSLLDSSGDLVALIMGRKLEAEESPAHGDLSRALREMDFYTKSTLVAVWEHGAADVTWIEPEDPDVYDDMFSEIDENFLRMTNGRLRDLESLKLVRHETVSGWDRRWTLEDGVADLLAENADALEAAREDAGLTWERLTEIPGQGCPPSGGAVAKEDLDSLELRFRSMSFGAKMLCAGIWQNGGIEREPGPTMPAEEEVEEASGAGFVLAEPTSEFGRVRFLATGDLTTLFTERPEEYERVRSDFARGRYQIRDGRLVRVG